MGKKKKRRQLQKRLAERNGTKKQLYMRRATTLLGCSALPLIVAHPKVHVLLEFSLILNF